MPSHTPMKRKLVRNIKAQVNKSGMGGQVTSGGRPQPDTVKIISENKMKSGGRGR